MIIRPIMLQSRQTRGYKKNNRQKKLYISKYFTGNRNHRMNTIIYCRVLFSTAGILDISRFCNAFSIDLKIENLRKIYQHSWFNEFLEPKTLIGTSNLNTICIYCTSTIIPFDIIPYISAMIIGLSEEKYSNSVSITEPQTLTFKYLEFPKQNESSTNIMHKTKACLNENAST